MFLIVHDGPQKLWELELPSELVTIGRAPGNTLVLPDREVAERHAQIEPAGHFHVLRDRASDGTYVNGRAVSLEILKPGDTIRIARYTLRVVAHPSSPRGGPESPAGSAESARADAEQGKLLGSVARHIRSGLDEIERRLPLLRPAVSEEAMGHVLEKVEETCRALSAFVDRFVELADLQLESEDETLTFAPASPREMVQRAVGAVREEARGRRIMISERLPEALPRISAHAPRLTRALTHLLSSAVRSSPEGGIVTLKACAGAEGLQVDVLLDEGAAASPLEVLGAGRLSAGGSHADQALALLVARRIIREHGGEVRLSAPARPRGGPAGLSVVLPCSSGSGSGAQAPETVSAGGDQPTPPPAAV